MDEVHHLNPVIKPRRTPPPNNPNPKAGPKMRNQVALIWVLGAIVTLIAYQLGPNHVLAAIIDFLAETWRQLERWLYDLSHASLELVRAGAIGLYVVFIALCILVLRAGGRARTALVVISGLFFLLVWGGDFSVSNDRWFTAFALVGVGAAIMTRRLSKQP